MPYNSHICAIRLKLQQNQYIQALKYKDLQTVTYNPMRKSNLKGKIKFSNPKNAHVGKNLNYYELDEDGQMPRLEGKVIKIWGVFYLYYEKRFFWFRLFDGYGLWGRSLKVKAFELFSERYSYTKYFKIFGWKLKWLKPSRF